MYAIRSYYVMRKGISLVSEAMNLFVNMTVNENLAMGAYTIRDKRIQKEQLDFTYNLFPRLAERRNQLAGTMSGGERKMLAIGRGLMANPTVITSYSIHYTKLYELLRVRVLGR